MYERDEIDPLDQTEDSFISNETLDNFENDGFNEEFPDSFDESDIMDLL